MGSPGEPTSVSPNTADAGSRPASDTAPLLIVSEVTKSFRHGLWPVGTRVQILRGASLEVRPGELVGLVGPYACRRRLPSSSASRQGGGNSPG
jgi:ABC-type glutathione transport system ATPase component